MSNSRKELRERMEAYLAAGASEAWIVLPQSKRFERYGPDGSLGTSSFGIDLDAFFR